MKTHVSRTLAGSTRGIVSSQRLWFFQWRVFSHTQNPSKQPLPKKTKYPPGVWREKPTALGRKSVLCSYPRKTLWATAPVPVSAGVDAGPWQEDIRVASPTD